MAVQCYLFRGTDLLVRVDSTGVRVPLEGEAREAAGLATHTQRLEPVAGVGAVAGLLPDSFTPSGELRFEGLRQLFGHLPDEEYRMAGRALQLVEWDRSTQFCSRCGTPLRMSEAERAKQCPACARLTFPRIDPSIIVLIRRDDDLLLARSPHFPGRWYSTLAGFVEPGETLEEAVHREVMEEVGIRVTNLQYFGSQPWPFPHSLMVAFTADYADGEIRIQPGEIEDAQWFPIGQLPELPPPLSIARSLIDWAAGKR